MNIRQCTKESHTGDDSLMAIKTTSAMKTRQYVQLMSFHEIFFTTATLSYMCLLCHSYPCSPVFLWPRVVSWRVLLSLSLLLLFFHYLFHYCCYCYCHCYYLLSAFPVPAGKPELQGMFKFALLMSSRWPKISFQDEFRPGGAQATFVHDFDPTKHFSLKPVPSGPHIPCQCH